MNLGTGFGDFVTLGTIAYKIWELGWSEEKAADTQYKELGNEVRTLSGRSRKFHEKVCEADLHYLDGNLNSVNGVYDAASEEFKQESKQVAAEIRLTLRDCEEFLIEKKEYETRTGRRLARNYKWHFTRQDKRVNILRKRLHVHNEKLSLANEQLGINLLIDARAAVVDIWAVVSEQRSQEEGSGAAQEIHDYPVFSSVADRFQRFLFQNSPTNMAEGLPLAETFDAIVLHCKACHDTSASPEERYLAFLKTNWLIARLKESNSFISARPGLIYKRAVPRIQRALSAMTRRLQALVRFDEAALLALDGAYHIWPEPSPSEVPVSAPSHPLLPELDEKEVLHIENQMPNSADFSSVTVFESTKKRVRIVKQTMGSLAAGNPQLVPILDRIGPIDYDEYRLVPIYAKKPGVSKSGLEMSMYYRGLEIPFRFASAKQLQKFQWSLMGYEVAYSQDFVIFQFEGDKGFGTHKGHAQLWQEEVDDMSGTRDNISVATASSIVGHTTEDSPHRQGRLPLPTTSILASNGNFDCLQGQSLKSSALVIFTHTFNKTRKEAAPSRLTILYVELEPGVIIDHVECGCQGPAHIPCKCLRVNLTKREEHTFHKFKIRIGYSEIGSGGQLSISSFDLFPFRIPRNSKFDTLDVKEITHFSIKFRNWEEKRSFHEELILRLYVRNAQILAEQAIDRQLTRYEKESQRWRQKQRRNQVQPMSSSSSSLASHRVPPPEITLPDSGSNFADSIIRDLRAHNMSISSSSSQATDANQDASERSYSQARRTSSVFSPRTSNPTETASETNVNIGGRESPLRVLSRVIQDNQWPLTRTPAGELERIED